MSTEKQEVNHRTLAKANTILLSVIGFFLIGFYMKVDKMDDKLNSVITQIALHGQSIAELQAQQKVLDRDGHEASAKADQAIGQVTAVENILFGEGTLPNEIKPRRK